MGELRDRAKKMSRFLRIDPDEEVVAKYLGYKFVENRFDPDTETTRYAFEVNGEEKLFESRAIGLMMAFDEIEIMSWVKIKREGEGAKTKYIVEVIPSPNGSLTKKEQKELKKKSKSKKK